MKPLIVLSVCLLFFSTTLIAKDFRPPVPLKVYCVAHESEEGFRNPGVEDSARDIQESLKKKKDWFISVATREEAEIVLEVFDRFEEPSGRVKSEWQEYSKTYKTEEMDDYVVKAGLIIGNYSQEIVGKSQEEWAYGLWRMAAGNLVSQLMKFVETNYEKIRSGNLQSTPPKSKSVATDTETLTNQSVIEMIQAGLSETIILKKIQASECDFDTSSEELIRMKKEGATEDILTAMIECQE